MPETYGKPEAPEPEPSKVETFLDHLRTYASKAEPVFTEAVAGQGLVRRIVLYLVASVGIVLSISIDGMAGLFIGTFALIALLLLSMTDKNLS